jgi:hypothetical protein
MQILRCAQDDNKFAWDDTTSPESTFLIWKIWSLS